LFLVILVAVLVCLPLKDGFLAAQQQSSTISQDELIKQYKNSRFLDRITQAINSGEDDLLTINRQIADNQNQVAASQDKINTLSEQLANLDQQIQSSQTIINNILAQIDLKQSEIDTMQYQIEQKKVEISFQKQMIAEYLKVIFKDQSDMNSLQGNESYLNTLKLLLSDDTTSEKLRSIRYSEVLEEQGRTIFEKLGDMMEEQEADQKIMEVKKFNLIEYHQKLAAEESDLELMRQAKQSLLEQTKGEEDIYQQLLARSKSEQEDVLLEIDTLHKNLLYVQDRIKQLGSAFNPEDYASLLNVGNDKKLLDYLTYGLESGDFSPIWPVAPARGISAYFHDSAYAKLFGMQHNAVDIPTSQETPVRSAADGIVYKAADNGYGYSYIIVAHLGGYMTLYGHISKIMVRDGDMVKQGDIIGLSGGIPGSRGAGLYTTGPHLHFEVLKDGVNQDPLDYLNLAFLDLSALPDKYVSKALGDRSKVRRLPLKVKVRYNPQQLALADQKS